MRSGIVVKVAIVTLILLAGGGALALTAFGGGGGGGDAFKGSPMPPLYGDAQIAPVDAPLKAAEARGHRVAKAWLDAHPVTTDAAFSSWAVRALGPPPGAATSAQELAQLKTLAAHRDPAGVTAATWLESHGKKQPWKLFRKNAQPLLAPDEYGRLKQALSDAMDLGNTLQAAAKVQYARRSPYQADPSIHALNQTRYGGQVRDSYPSSHMVMAGAALALLGPAQAHSVAEYHWMADEIAYSRLYAGGHYLSDLTAGVFLGTLIGDYERRKAGLAS